MRLSRSAKIAMAVVCLTLVSCASYFKRKDCEATNWFEYGKGVAMRGDRLGSDGFYRECHQVEAEIDEVAADHGFKQGMSTYCQPENALAMGKRGEFFKKDLCDGDNTRLLLSKHKQGVTEYCQKSNGYTAGATGKPYNQICPKEQEGAFLPEFNRGRKVYLTSFINQKETEVDDLDKEIRNLESKRMNLQSQLYSLGNNKVIQREMKWDPATNSHKEVISMVEDEETKRRRDSLNSDVNSVNRDIESKRNQQAEIRKKVRELKTELATL